MRFLPYGPLLPTILTALFFLFACAKESEKKTGAAAVANPNAIQRNDLHKAYGLPFEIKPINSMKPEVRMAAEAVVYVRYADGGAASAFFISEDGLLITNNHVISRSSCTRQRCAGIQLIRDFRPGGAHEVYEDFEFLAASAEADISLVKVKLPPGKKVPFLKLSAKKLEKEDSLILLGHPGGASLHASASRLQQAKTLDTKFLSLAVGGNSGGPIVDSKTLEVVAVIHSINRRDERIDRGGVPTHYGMGTVMPTLERTFKAADSSFTISNPRFTVPANPTASQAEVAAPLKLEGELSVSRFMRTLMGTEGELAGLQQLFKDLAPKTFAKEEFDSLLETLVSIDLNRGKKLPVTAELLAAHQPEGYSPPHTAKVKYIGVSPEACLTENSEYSEITEFAYIGADCLQTVTSKGVDAFAVLRKVYEEEKGRSWGGEQESRNNLLLLGIESQLVLRPSLSKEDSELVKAVLKKIGTDAPVMKQYFSADRLLTMVADKPELVAPGSFKNL